MILVLAMGVGIISPSTAERFYRMVIRDRLLAPIWIALTTNRENVETTKLPIYELDITPRYQRELDADLLQNKFWFGEPQQNIRQNIAADDSEGDDDAPASYQHYKPAIFRYNGIRYPVEVRYRGDNTDHREGHQKSWRVKFKKNDRFENQRLINLVNPKTPTALTLACGYEMARELGLLSPDSYFVHKVVNREYEGVSLFIEQIDAYYLINHGLTEGNIYYGEWHPPDQCPPGKSLLENPQAWTPARIMVPEDPRPGCGAIERFIHALTIEDNDTFTEEFSKIFDLNDWYNVYAHAAICGFFHCDTFHNHKYYFDPTSGKLRTIVWSLNGLGYPQEIRDQEFFPPTNVTNLCTGRIMAVPELTERKNQRLWEHLQGKLTLEKQLAIYDQLYALIRDDMRADAFKDAQEGMRRIYTNEAWEAEVRMQRQWIKDRHAYLCQALNRDDFRFGPDPQFKNTHINHNDDDKQILVGFLLTNGGECGVRVDTIGLINTSEWAKGKYALYWDVDEDNKVNSNDFCLTNAIITQGEQELTLTIPRAFLPGRKKVQPNHWSYWKKLLPYELISCPARYRLLLTGPRQDKAYNITAACHLVVNNVTDAIVKVQPLSDSPENTIRGTRPFAYDDDRKISNTITWGPGETNIDADIIIPRSTRLVIKPGTTVSLASGASILCYGPV
ncbi:MAG: CotH kinase family protein, partial [Sedimentisphaerales bacterium]|nr:CotH kinase family protein [Sedimentisphaerales bacterium]